MPTLWLHIRMYQLGDNYASLRPQTMNSFFFPQNIANCAQQLQQLVGRAVFAEESAHNHL